MGLDLHSLLSQINPNTGTNWKLKDIQAVLNKYPNAEQRHSVFTGKIRFNPNIPRMTNPANAYPTKSFNPSKPNYGFGFQ